MYSPTLGRFMQADPIGYGDGLNWYRYVGNEPINFSDPTGLFWQREFSCSTATGENGELIGICHNDYTWIDLPPDLLAVQKIDFVFNQKTGTITQHNQCFSSYGAARRASGVGRKQTPVPNTSGVGQVYSGNYAGKGSGVNNPSEEGRSSIGPLPRGRYTIGPAGTQVTGRGTRLQNAMRLYPDASNDMKGRAGFLIHGGNMQSQSSSEGCIVAPNGTRNDIGGSGDNVLWSVS
jgi:hypothetical protein